MRLSKLLVCCFLLPQYLVQVCLQLKRHLREFMSGYFVLTELVNTRPNFLVERFLNKEKHLMKLALDRFETLNKHFILEGELGFGYLNGLLLIKNPRWLLQSCLLCLKTTLCSQALIAQGLPLSQVSNAFWNHMYERIQIGFHVLKRFWSWD